MKEFGKDDLLSFVAVLAMRAGELALARRKTLSSSQIHSKASDTDLVTDVDREVENFIIERLRSETPGYGIYGEEFGKDRADAPFCWVIDPIDGTTNFIRDLPFYSVSIALRHGGENVLGAVFAPKLGELFLAEKGKGATRNGEKLCVSGVSELKRAVVATGFSCVRAKRKFDNLGLLADVARATCAFRRCGSAAIDLCYVAEGKYDAFWELALQLYDLAAGEVVLREAGGVVTDLFGADQYPQKGLLADNRVIHSKMLHFFRPETGILFE